MIQHAEHGPATAAQAARARTTSRSRHLWMDGLRGLAIVLIVELHASAIMRMHGINPSPVLEWLDVAVYPFRIPMLMLLSGMLLHASLAKGTRRYLVGKARTILWPFAVWSVLLVLAYDFMPWSSLLDALVAPGSHLWFLHALLVAYLLALALRRVPTWISALGAFAAAGIVALVDLPTWAMQLQPERLLMMLGYFLAGATLRARWDVVEGWLRRTWVLVALLAAAAALVALSVAPDIRVSYTMAEYAPLVLAGVLALVAVAIRLPWTSWPARALRAIGRDSIVFYVTHWFVLMALVWPLWLVPDFVPLDVQVLAVATSLLAAAGLAWLSHRIRLVGLLFRL
ncbi:acyltransferase family protein [Agrococcus sp. SGAir0287]|uniref:acyltransferase family protein n=1 Tax=Agrococcus sp. SGAir0287 TaxID=2070347 RepID=UPI0010CD25CB|nr:acyltransferase family protein [Agrococcus sp. SGAir0287]QCR18962.1 hypothetical protein C1N71_05460 [Agrococcus sp. SGAir0287]